MEERGGGSRLKVRKECIWREKRGERETRVVKWSDPMLRLD